MLDVVEYVLGYTPSEVRRLALQSDISRPATEKLLRDVGLVPGMRVLDVGCGIGDMAMLMAGIVGTSGAVVGIDREEVAIAAAQQRAAAGGYSIEFRQVDLATRPELGKFDLAIARFVLVHQPDPVSFVQAVSSYVKPGGVVAFQEFLATLDLAKLPDAPLWHRCVELISSAFCRALPHPDVAIRFSEVFHAAGLDGATVTCDVVVESDAQTSTFFEMFALTLQSLTPFLERSGLITPGELDMNTIEQRLREEALSRHSLRIFTPQFCCWSRR